MQIDQIYDGAQAYFAYGAHPLADRWAGYSEGARRGALTYAVKQFSRALTYAVPLDRENWREAVYEQAIALLVTNRVARTPGEGDAWTLQAQAEASTAAGVPDIEMVGPFSAEALRAAGWNGHAIMRG
jgi:hypothetical protein